MYTLYNNMEHKMRYLHHNYGFYTFLNSLDKEMSLDKAWACISNFVHFTFAHYSSKDFIT